MKKIHYTWSEFDQDTLKLALKIAQSGWRPDYIVGLSRGGCVPAVSLSHTLNVPMKPLQISLRDGDASECVSDCGMAEDAFGWIYDEQREAADPSSNSELHSPEAAKNILVVDDINDSGATFQWIQQDWQKSCLPKHPRWKSVWHQNVRFAVLHNNEASKFKKTDYAVNYINKRDHDVWIVYPWEALNPDK